MFLRCHSLHGCVLVCSNAPLYVCGYMFYSVKCLNFECTAMSCVLFLFQRMHSAHICIGLPERVGKVITAEHTVSLLSPSLRRYAQHTVSLFSPSRELSVFLLKGEDRKRSRRDFFAGSQLSGRIDEENRLFLWRQEAYRCE